ncbi:MAG: hypothetical protein J0L60_06810 [Ignavibacteria bacterium]|nr:hypothetical protein [Ignavibacteria bacterium]
MKKIYTLLFILALVPLTFGQIVPKFGLGINGGVAIPSGDMGDIYKTGVGGSVTFVLPLPIPVELSASIGYYSFKFNNDYFATQLKTYTGSTPVVDVDAPLNLIPLTVNARYYMTPIGIRPYGEVNVGIGIASLKNVFLQGSGNSMSIKTEDKSETKQYLAAGVGVLIGVGIVADIDVNIRYALLGQEFSQMTTTGNTVSYSSSSGSYLGINAGLRLKL